MFVKNLLPHEWIYSTVHGHNDRTIVDDILQCNFLKEGIYAYFIPILPQFIFIELPLATYNNWLCNQNQAIFIWEIEYEIFCLQNYSHFIVASIR